MHVQVLASGSRGNSLLVRAGEQHLLVDAGLSLRELEARLEKARVAPRRIGHVAVTHGHLDHARSAGALARKADARVVCAERLLGQRSVRRAPRFACLRMGDTMELTDDARSPAANAPDSGHDRLLLKPVRIPHDADPTVAFRIEHRGRVAVVLTDMGRPEQHVARALAGAHLLLIEFNHDVAQLLRGPYTEKLKRRVRGPHGHLSNEEAARMLGWLAGPELHTVVLTHLSQQNNSSELARRAAEGTLAKLGRRDVTVLLAEQDRLGPNLRV